MPKIFLVAHIPADEVGAFLKVIREWEVGRPEIEMAINIDDSHGEIEHAEEMLKSLTPELPVFVKIDRKK